MPAQCAVRADGFERDRVAQVNPVANVHQCPVDIFPAACANLPGDTCFAGEAEFFIQHRGGGIVINTDIEEWLIHRAMARVFHDCSVHEMNMVEAVIRIHVPGYDRIRLADGIGNLPGNCAVDPRHIAAIRREEHIAARIGIRLAHRGKWADKCALV